MKLSVPPSIQHFVSFYDETPERVCRKVLNFWKNKPNFSYRPLTDILYSSLTLTQESLPQILHSISISITRKSVRNLYLELAPILYTYLADSRFNYRSKLAYPVSYSAGKDFQIPIGAPLFMGTHSGLVVPCINTWKSDRLTDYQKSVLMTIFAEQIFSHPDFVDARIEYVSTAPPKGSSNRQLLITPFDRNQMLNREEIKAVLEIIYAGYVLAHTKRAESDESAALASITAYQNIMKDQGPQADLFD